MSALKTVVLFGASGQLGQELLRALEPIANVVPTTRTGKRADGTPCETVDFDRLESVTALLDRIRPDWVVNAAAYTAVDQAEDDCGTAWRINADVPESIARWCAAAGALIVHYSTDYVFDGTNTRPYLESDATAPLGVYGASKLAGELAVGAAGGQHLIFRVSWLYASRGANFLRTMLRIGREREIVRVVDDQIGVPTPASLVAEVTVQALLSRRRLSGTYHVAARGRTSWWGFADKIFGVAVDLGVLDHAPILVPISSSEYPMRAARPTWSVLDTSRIEGALGREMPDWQTPLRSVIRQVRDTTP